MIIFSEIVYEFFHERNYKRNRQLACPFFSDDSDATTVTDGKSVTAAFSKYRLHHINIPIRYFFINISLNGTGEATAMNSKCAIFSKQ